MVFDGWQRAPLIFLVIVYSVEHVTDYSTNSLEMTRRASSRIIPYARNRV